MKTNVPINYVQCLYLGISYNRKIYPDPGCLEPFAQRYFLYITIGILANYSKWIPRFSEKVYALVDVNKFPLTQAACLKLWKNDITDSFTVETQSSEYTISATLRMDTLWHCFLALLFIVNRSICQ